MRGYCVDKRTVDISAKDLAAIVEAACAASLAWESDDLTSAHTQRIFQAMYHLASVLQVIKGRGASA